MLRCREVSGAFCKQAWKDSSLAPLGCALLLASHGVGGKRPLLPTFLSPCTISLHEVSRCLLVQKVGARARLPLSAFLRTIQAEAELVVGWN